MFGDLGCRVVRGFGFGFLCFSGSQLEEVVGDQDLKPTTLLLLNRRRERLRLGLLWVRVYAGEPPGVRR